MSPNTTPIELGGRTQKNARTNGRPFTFGCKLAAGRRRSGTGGETCVKETSGSPAFGSPENGGCLYPLIPATGSAGISAA